MGSSSIGPDDTPNTEAEVLTAVIGAWDDICAIQVQSIRSVVTVRSRRPIMAVVASICRRRCIEVAGVEEVVRKGSVGPRHHCACRGSI